MFSYGDRNRAIQLLIKYNMAYARVRKELGYPSKTALFNWYKEYIKNNELHENYVKRPRYSDEECLRAVNYYLEHGKNISHTVKALGYPCRSKLSEWIRELAPQEKGHCNTGRSLVKYPQEFKKQAVISLCSREKPAREVAEKYGISRVSLYVWQKQLLKEGSVRLMVKKDKPPLGIASNKENPSQTDDLQAENKHLLEQVDTLQRQIHRLQLEHDILEKAVEVIKKEEGISLKTLTNREKATVINALREKYLLKDLLNTLDMAKSSYSYQTLTLKKEDKYANLRNIVKEIFNVSVKRYGYRRIHAIIKATGTTLSEKVVRRIMIE